MQIKSKSDRHFELPTDKEEVAINAGIDADPDTYELTNAELENLRPASRPTPDVPSPR